MYIEKSPDRAFFKRKKFTQYFYKIYTLVASRIPGKHTHCSEKWSPNHRKSSPDRPKNRCQKALERSSKACSYPASLLGGCAAKFWGLFSHFKAYWRPRWLHVGGQDGPKIDKKRCPKTINFWTPLGRPSFQKIFDLGGQHGRKLAPKSRPKSMLSSKGGFYKKHCFSWGRINCFRFAHPPRPASMSCVFCAKCESQASKPWRYPNAARLRTHHRPVCLITRS